ncbi:MAG TPA: hypothetical protein VI485_22980 [Vicinamibacterales bacterium]|nr:hypothetical protein [Vicinamibacterales bacterium]
MKTMSTGTVCFWTTNAPGSSPLKDGERRSVVLVPSAPRCATIGVLVARTKRPKARSGAVRRPV